MNHIDNLKAIIAAVEAEPVLDLSAYRQRTACGTLFCVAGLLPTLPHFQALGVTARGGGAPFTRDMGIDELLDDLFGEFDDESAYQCLCASRPHGAWDAELITGDMTDKELALARLNKALAIREAEANHA